MDDGDICKEESPFWRESQAQLKHTEFEMFVIHPSEQKSISEHLLSIHCVVGPVLSISEV